MGLKGINVNGTLHKIDHENLDGVPDFLNVSSSDKGKALMVDNEGKWAASNLPSDLPQMSSSDSGKALLVDEHGEWGASLLPPSLPDTTNADAGKGLLVDENGEWIVTQLPSGSGAANLPYVTSDDEGKILMVDSNGVWIASPLVLVQNQNGTWSAVYVGDAENSSIDANGNIHSNSSGEVPSGSSGGLPGVTGLDEGKVLIVNSQGQWVAAQLTLQQNNNGTWTSVSVSDAEGASF